MTPSLGSANQNEQEGECVGKAFSSFRKAPDLFEHRYIKHREDMVMILAKTLIR